MKARIIKRTKVSGSIHYVIQQRHWFFRWLWVAGWINNLSAVDTFPTLESARANMRYFDGSRSTDEVIEGV